MDFHQGDRVRHAARPEWGLGIIQSIQPLSTEGMPAQRMVIDFANQGRVTVNTAYASIVPEGTDLAGVAPRKNTAASPSTSGGGGGGGWLAELERSQNTANSPAAAGNGDSLTMLPDKCSDPFMPLGRRLMHTLDLYRFSSEPRSLIDWAVAQTRLEDPLSRHTRHELEHGFTIFSQMRDSHLKELLRLIKRKGEQALIAEAREHPLPAARAALDKALRTL
ncbi:MAG: DUF3553 domain-containing protein [Phycisphaerales bacterium]